jgi:hypothetical protein
MYTAVAAAVDGQEAKVSLQALDLVPFSFTSCLLHHAWWRNSAEPTTVRLVPVVHREMWRHRVTLPVPVAKVAPTATPSIQDYGNYW